MFFPLQLQTILIKGKAVSLFVPDATTVQLAYQKGEISFPYWSKVWPAAIGLSEFLCSHPQYIKDKKVLELAAGLGLPSIIAARNAASVVSTDYVSEATAVIQQSAEYNRLKNVSVALLDWHALPQDMETDVLLLSDINYDPAMFIILLQLLHRFLQKETTVILSTPQRLMGKEFIAALLPYCKHREELIVNDSGADVPVSVLVLQQ